MLYIFGKNYVQEKSDLSIATPNLCCKLIADQFQQSCHDYPSPALLYPTLT